MTTNPNAFFRPCKDLLCISGRLLRPALTTCSSVGRPKHLRVMAGAIEGDTFIGKKAQELRGLLRIKYPMTHGVVTDWDDMEKIWAYVYEEELKILSEEVSCHAYDAAPLRKRQTSGPVVPASSPFD